MVKVEPEYDDNVVTCSQMVYDCYASEKQSHVRFPLKYCTASPCICFYAVNIDSMVCFALMHIGNKAEYSVFLIFIL